MWHFGIKKNPYPPRWICITHIWSLTLFSRGILIFKGVLTKINFLMTFPHLEKFVSLMKDLKYEHQSIFPLLGRVKLNFMDRYGKLNFFCKNSSHCQVFFTKLSKNETLFLKKNHYPPRWICITHKWSRT